MSLQVLQTQTKGSAILSKIQGLGNSTGCHHLFQLDGFRKFLKSFQKKISLGQTAPKVVQSFSTHLNFMQLLWIVVKIAGSQVNSSCGQVCRNPCQFFLEPNLNLQQTNCRSQPVKLCLTSVPGVLQPQLLQNDKVCFHCLCVVDHHFEIVHWLPIKHGHCKTQKELFKL